MNFGALILAVIIALCTKVTNADVLPGHPLASDDPKLLQTLVDLRLEGNITSDDLSSIRKLLAEVQESRPSKPVHLWLFLNSPGGDLRTAIAIGRLLREHEGAASVLHDQKCASACVFILAGAVTRMPFGKVIIHRPYMPDDDITSSTEQKKKYNQLKQEVDQYLEEVNISKKLYDDMLRISPSDGKVLTNEQLADYGLSSRDPYYDEGEAVRKAKELGISRVEYARKEAAIREMCSKRNPYSEFDPAEVDRHSDYWIKCHDRIMNEGRGVSLRPGRLGIKVADVTNDLAAASGILYPHGAFVVIVEPSSAAEAAEIKRGDVITEFNGTKIDLSSQLPPLVRSLSVGERVLVKAIRNGQEIVFEVKLAE